MSFNTSKMKRIFTLVSLLLLLFNTTAQTKIIAHKSHSGTSGDFSVSDYDDNLGLSLEFKLQLDTVIKLTNNSVIEIFHLPHNNSERIVDTMTNHPVFNNPEVSLDSMKKRYPSVEFIGFDTPTKTQKKSKKQRMRASLYMSFSDESTNKGSGLTILKGISLLLFVVTALLLWRNQARTQNTHK